MANTSVPPSDETPDPSGVRVGSGPLQSADIDSPLPAVPVGETTRTIVDADLKVWEVYPSGGPFGLPTRPKVVFHCLSDPDARPRYVPRNDPKADEADAEDWVRHASDDELRDLLRASLEIDEAEKRSERAVSEESARRPAPPPPRR